MSNLRKDFGPEVAKEYGGSFTEDERKQMFVMSTFIKQHGEVEARKAVTKGLTLVQEEELTDG